MRLAALSLIRTPQCLVAWLGSFLAASQTHMCLALGRVMGPCHARSHPHLVPKAPLSAASRTWALYMPLRSSAASSMCSQTVGMLHGTVSRPHVCLLTPPCNDSTSSTCTPSAGASHGTISRLILALPPAQSSSASGIWSWLLQLHQRSQCQRCSQWGQVQRLRPASPPWFTCLNALGFSIGACNAVSFGGSAFAWQMLAYVGSKQQQNKGRG